MSVDRSAFGRKSHVFPVTAPLRPIKPTGQDRQISPRLLPSGSAIGLNLHIGQGDDRSSTRQVSVALPAYHGRPIGLLLGLPSVKDLSTCISTRKAGVPVLSSISVSKKMSKSAFIMTVITKIADSERNRFATRSPKGDRSQAPA
jgi:hypothetical protein